MTQDPGIEAYVARAVALEAADPPPRSVEERRAQYLARCRHFDRPLPPDLAVRDDALAAVPVRIYRPGPGRRPAVVYFHGGGWVLGDLESHHGITAGIAAGTGAVVIAVHYRRAPEHPYPAAFEDALAATRAAAEAAHRLAIDGARLAVAGDSAGGNLAAAVCLAARDRGGPPLRGQALVYPCLDPDLALPSCQRHADGPLLSRAAMREFWLAYLGGVGGTDDPLAAPLRARDLSGLPPALVATAGRDPLCDEGRIYAERLRAAGVPVAYREAAPLVHGYLRARFLSAAADAEFQALCAWLRAALG